MTKPLNDNENSGFHASFHGSLHASLRFHASSILGLRHFSTHAPFSTLLKTTSVERSVERISLEKPPFLPLFHSFYSSILRKEEKREKERWGRNTRAREDAWTAFRRSPANDRHDTLADSDGDDGA